MSLWLRFALSAAMLLAGCARESSLGMDNRVIAPALSSEVLKPSLVIEGKVLVPWSIKSVDSLLLLRTLEFKNSMLVFDPATETIIDTIFLSGRGPGEYINLATQGQYRIEDGDIKLWTRDNNIGKVRKSNISDYEHNRHEVEYDLGKTQLYNLYHIDDDRLLGDYYDERNLYLSLYNPQTQEREDMFTFFKKPVMDITVASCNSTLKGDYSRVAYAMIYFNQIVLASTDGLDRSSVSLGTPVSLFDVLDKQPPERDTYFLSITSSKDRICALLAPDDSERGYSCSTGRGGR